MNCSVIVEPSSEEPTAKLLSTIQLAKHDHSYSIVNNESRVTAGGTSEDECLDDHFLSFLFWNIDGKNSWKDWHEKNDLTNDEIYQNDVIFSLKLCPSNRFPRSLEKIFIVPKQYDQLVDPLEA